MGTVTKPTEREIERALFGEIASIAENINRCAMNMDLPGVRKYLKHLYKLSKWIDIIREQSRQEPGQGPAER